VQIQNNLKLITIYCRLIPKNDLIILQIRNIFSELMIANVREKNDNLNDFFNSNIKHLMNGTIPKEDEAILSKSNEV